MSTGHDAVRNPPAPQTLFARRLNLLLDAVAVQRGRPVTFSEVKQGLAERGVPMSRARWFYMKDGTRCVVKNKGVLTAICEMFDVDPLFLIDLDSVPFPSPREDRLDAVKALRAARLLAFAERMLADVAPETLVDITECLNRGIPAGAGSQMPQMHWPKEQGALAEEH